MFRYRIAMTLLLLFACRAVPDGHISAASALTRRYALSRFQQWNVRASAAGKDCSVLLVETSVVLDESMVEAMHYGIGPYAIEERGLQSFSQDGGFRGVVYKDPTARVFPYGDLGAEDPKSLAACH
jgi:hypothetical protein